uniref:Uncharacterized protein n=1 Tax=viral metagenome TaxID=1070528 RepID=A0A6M3INA7_9ZZZZ
MENLEQIKTELREKIAKCDRIVRGLEHHDPFVEMISDFNNQMKRLDTSWQWITDEKLLKEAQITKMAYLSVVNVIDNYKHDMEEADKQLVELDNPDKITGKDFDNG